MTTWRARCGCCPTPQPRWPSFLNGSYDWLEVPGNSRQLAAPRGQLAPSLAKKGIRLQKMQRPDMTMSVFYMPHPLVGGYTPDKVALRRAIGLAFDGDAYRELVYGGYGVPAQSTVAPFTSGYDPAYKSEMSEHSRPKRARGSTCTAMSTATVTAGANSPTASRWC